jgi:hypothetical protein
MQLIQDFVPYQHEILFQKEDLYEKLFRNKKIQFIFYQSDLYLKKNDHLLYLNLNQLLNERHFVNYWHCLLETKQRKMNSYRRFLN